MELPLSPLKYGTLERQTQFMDQVLDRVRALPRVASAGMSTNIPMQFGVTLDSIYEAEGRSPANPSEVPTTGHRMVTPGYTETIGLTLLEGRMLDARDRAGAQPVAVVSEALVHQARPGESGLGKRVRRIRAGERGPWMTVVGVVRDVKEDRFWFRIDRPVWYLPYAQRAFPAPVSVPLNLVVRAAGAPARLPGDPAGIAAAVSAAVHAVDPDQPVAAQMPMTEALSDVLIAERFGAVLMGTLAALGLLLAALGLYGVMAYTVGRRTGEIGLRMALGASPRDVLRLVVGQGVWLVGIGLALGVGGAWALTRLIAGGLYQVGAADPKTFAGVALLLAAVTLLACWVPARRATRIDPLAALRSE